MKIKKIDYDLFIKECPTQPTTEYIEKEFKNFLDYCEEKEYMPTKHNWYVFLGATRQQINGWKNAARGIATINEEEFNKRRDTMKKIEDFIEESLAYTLISSERALPNLMLYMKNSYKWTDRPQQDDISINIKTKGFSPTNKPKKGKK